jgi:TonB family protein
MRSESGAGLAAISALVFSGTAFAQAACDCTNVVDSCRATATLQDGFIEVTSDVEQCSRVDYLVDGIPLVSLVVGGNERQDWDNEVEASSVVVQSCQVCLETVAGSAASFGGAGLYADGDVTALIEVSPAYPPEALQSGVEGYVEIRFDVDLNGRVTSPEVVASEPAGIFDQAALDAIRQWRYTIPADEPQTVTERITFNPNQGVLSLRPRRESAPEPAASARPARNSCIQEQTRFDFGAMIDVSLINACQQPLLVYRCSAGTGAFADRWVCANPENAGMVIEPSGAGRQTVASADGSEAFAAAGRIEITRAPNSEYWLLACAVDDMNCRSDGREWVRSLDRQAATIDPQARTRARLARSY